MVPIKRIVCPIDFSAASLAALQEAVELAAHFEADIYLAHVGKAEKSDPEMMVIVEPEEEILASIRQALQDIAARFAFKGVTIFFSAAVGDPAAQIVKIANSKQADLIVIATHGRTGWRHLAFGSVTEEVIRTAACPVLTVRVPERNSIAACDPNKPRLALH